MAGSSDQTVRLLLKVLGTEGLTGLKEEAAYTRKSVEQLGDAYAQGQVKTNVFMQESARLGRQYDRLQKQIEALESAERKEADAAKAEAESVKLAAKALEDQEAAAKKLTAAFGDYLSMTAPLPNAEREKAAATKAASVAFSDYAGIAAKVPPALDKVPPAAEKVRSGLAGSGQAALQASRALQDFTQGGIGGVLNNVEGVTQALGGGAGLAGLMTGVGVAIFLAKPYVEGWIKDMGLFADETNKGKTAVERLEERIKELEGKKIKLQVDRNELTSAEADLKRIKDATEAYNKLKSGKSKAERESESAVDEALGEAGPQYLSDLEKAEQAKIDRDPGVAQKRGQIEALKARQADLQRRFEAGEAATGESWGKQIAKLMMEQKEREAEMGAILATAGGSAHSRVEAIFAPAAPGKAGDRNERIAKALGGVGQDTLARQVRDASPAAMKAKEALRLKEEADKENKRLDDEAAKEQKKEDDERDRREAHKVDVKLRGEQKAQKEQAAMLKKNFEDGLKQVKAGDRGDRKADSEDRKADAATQAEARRLAGGDFTGDAEAESFLNQQATAREALDNSGMNAATRNRQARRQGILSPQAADIVAMGKLFRDLKGATDKDGNALTAEQRKEIAREMLQMVKADLANRNLALRNQGVEPVDRGAMIDAQLGNEEGAARQKMVKASTPAEAAHPGGSKKSKLHFVFPQGAKPDAAPQAGGGDGAAVQLQRQGLWAIKGQGDVVAGMQNVQAEMIAEIGWLRQRVQQQDRVNERNMQSLRPRGR